MDRNNLFGLVLIFVIFAGSFYLMKPSEEEIKQEQARQDSTELLTQNEATSSDSLDKAEADSVRSGFEAVAQNEEEFILENDKLIVKVSNKGGSVKSVQVKGE